MTMLRLIDFEKVSQQYSELSSMLKKSKDLVQIQLLEESENEVANLMNKILHSALCIIQDKIQKKTQEEWNTLSSKE